MIQTEKFVRKPFEVEAVQVTKKNMRELSKMTKGTIVKFLASEKYPAGQYIRINKVTRPLTDRQKRAYVGDWILIADSGYKVYSNEAFHKSFDPVETKEIREQDYFESMQALRDELMKLRTEMHQQNLQIYTQEMETPLFTFDESGKRVQ